MPIHHLLKNSAFDPEEVGVLASAFDAAVEGLKLTDRAGPTAELIAKRHEVDHPSLGGGGSLK